MTIDPSQLAPWISMIVAVGGAAAVLYRVMRTVERTMKEVTRLKMDIAMSLKGLRAALDGLHEQGCNGPVTEALTALNHYIVDSR